MTKWIGVVIYIILSWSLFTNYGFATNDPGPFITAMSVLLVAVPFLALPTLIINRSGSLRARKIWYLSLTIIMVLLVAGTYLSYPIEEQCYPLWGEVGLRQPMKTVCQISWFVWPNY